MVLVLVDAKKRLMCLQVSVGGKKVIKCDPIILTSLVKVVVVISVRVVAVALNCVRWCANLRD